LKQYEIKTDKIVKQIANCRVNSFECFMFGKFRIYEQLLILRNSSVTPL